MNQARGIAAVALGLLAALAAGTPARAQVCSTMCSMYVSGQCVEYTQTCETPTRPAHSYGAIAYGSKSQAWGYSYNWDSREKAERVAMQNCAQRAKDCEVAVWYDFKCGAVAAGGGAGYFWGVGDGAGEARTEALNKCEKGGGKGCAIQVSQCSR